MPSTPLSHRAYRERRALILATATVCGICGGVDCPHCHGKARHCKGKLGHLDHKIPRSKGGTMTAGNEQASHSCCNLRKGDRSGVDELKTSRDW